MAAPTAAGRRPCQLAERAPLLRPPHPCSEPEKLACCEQALRLLASRLWAPGAAGRSAAYAADGQDGLGLLLRAVLAGTELAEASAADDSWQVGSQLQPKPAGGHYHQPMSQATAAAFLCRACVLTTPAAAHAALCPLPPCRRFLRAMRLTWARRLPAGGAP